MTGSHFKVIQCVRYFWLIRICRGEIRHFLLSLFFYIMDNLVFINESNDVLTDSLRVVVKFEKDHSKVIRSIELEPHGCDIAERSLREFLQEQGFFYKNKREWILTENVMKKGYAHYRYNTDTGIRNTVYMTRKGFEKTLYNIRNIPKSRESFISFGGKIFD